MATDRNTDLFNKLTSNSSKKAFEKLSTLGPEWLDYVEENGGVVLVATNISIKDTAILNISFPIIGVGNNINDAVSATYKRIQDLWKEGNEIIVSLPGSVEGPRFTHSPETGDFIPR